MKIYNVHIINEWAAYLLMLLPLQLLGIHLHM